MDDSHTKGIVTSRIAGLGRIHFVPLYHHFDTRKKRVVRLTLSPGSPCLPGGPGSPSALSP